MPASSRINDLFGYGPDLFASDDALLPGETGLQGWPDILANGMFGGHLTVAADTTYARIRVELSWPDIRVATVERVHADGTTYPVRGLDPATVCSRAARWDYEAPLDQAVTYRATSVERAGATAISSPVTVSSAGRHWLKSVAKPDMNLAVSVYDKGSRQQAARRASISPPTRPDSIFVYQVREKDKGNVVLYASDQATETAIRALLAAGGPLLWQQPSVAGGESLYLMVDTASYDPPVRMTVDLQRVIALPFDGIGRPPGAAAGGPNDSYADIAATYPTYNHQAASGKTYLEVSML